MLPSVWPGVAMTRAPPPKSMVSPSPSSTSTGQAGTGGMSADHLREDRLLGRGERRLGAAAHPAHDRRVGAVGVHRDAAPTPATRAAEPVWSSCPWVITMRRRSDAAEAQLVERGGEGGLAAGDPGVDERDAVVVAPEVGLPERGPDQVQTGAERHDLHTLTVGPRVTSDGRVRARRSGRSGTSVTGRRRFHVRWGENAAFGCLLWLTAPSLVKEMNASRRGEGSRGMFSIIASRVPAGWPICRGLQTEHENGARECSLGAAASASTSCTPRGAAASSPAVASSLASARRAARRCIGPHDAEDAAEWRFPALASGRPGPADARDRHQRGSILTKPRSCRVRGRARRPAPAAPRSARAGPDRQQRPRRPRNAASAREGERHADQARGQRVAGGRVDEQEAAGGADGGVLVDGQRVRGAQRDAGDVVDRELVGRVDPGDGVGVQPLAQRPDDRLGACGCRA